MSPPPPRLVETLHLQLHKGEGLLLRLYSLLHDLADANADLAFLRHEKAFASLTKSLSAVTKNLGGHQLSPKQTEELLRMRSKVKKHLTVPFETLLDVKQFLDVLPKTFEACRSLQLDMTQAPELTKLYLDLVVLLPSLLLLASRIEPRKTIALAVRHCAGNDIDGLEEYPAFCDFLSLGLARPLLTAFEIFKPFQSTLKTAFLSSVCLAFVRLRSSCEQWKKEEFLSLRNLVPANDETTTSDSIVSMTPCMGNPPGIETIELERMEKWFFFGFLFCHSVVDVAKKEAGEYRVWTMLMQGMWVMPIIRDEVLWVHEELSHFFKSLKGSKSNQPGVTKKAQEMKIFMATALKSAPTYRMQRRLYLTSLLDHYYSLLVEEPGLIGPRLIHITQLASLSKAELNWLLRHIVNVPQKKQELSLLQGQKVQLRLGPECLSLCHSLQRLRSLVLNHARSCVTPYLKAQIAGWDAPALREQLEEEVAKINDPEIGTHPMQVALASLEALAKATVREEGDGIEFMPGNLSEPLSKGLKMDLSRLQAFLVFSPSDEEGKRKLRRPLPPTVTRQLDSLLCHLDLLLSTPGDKEAGEVRDVLVENARNRCGILSSTDLSLLPVGYPEALRSLFNFSVDSEGLAAAASVSLAEINEHLSVHPLCPEDAEKWSKTCAENANYFLRQISKKLFSQFREWVSYQWMMSEVLLPSNESCALRTALSVMSRRVKSSESSMRQRSESMVNIERIMKAQNLKKKEATWQMKGQIDKVYSRIVNLCHALSLSNEIVVNRYTFSPKELFLQALEADFQSFVTPLLQITGSDTDNLPSLVLARLHEYIWCLLSLCQHLLPSLSVDASAHCLRLLASLQQGPSLKGVQSPSGRYVSEIFTRVIKPLVDGNVLVYSQTFQSFVLPHCLQQSEAGSSSGSGGEQSPNDPAAVLMYHRFISDPELRALASLMGSEGIQHLIEELIFNEGVVKELRALKNCLPNEQGSISVLKVLVHGIKAGCFLAIRQLLLDALSEESSERMPRLHETLSRMSRDCEVNVDHSSVFMGLSETTQRKEFSLVSLLTREGIFNRDDLFRLIDAFATAIPQAARFASTRFVPEALNFVGSKSSPDGLVCIDGHFNNLNCLAIVVSQLLTAVFHATIEDEDDLDSETRCFEMFLSSLARNMLRHISDVYKNKEADQAKETTESVTLLLSLIVDKCPELDHDRLRQVFPLPLPLLHRARNLFYASGEKKKAYQSMKKFKAMTMDQKSLANEHDHEARVLQK